MIELPLKCCWEIRMTLKCHIPSSLQKLFPQKQKIFEQKFKWSSVLFRLFSRKNCKPRITFQNLFPMTEHWKLFWNDFSLKFKLFSNKFYFVWNSDNWYRNREFFLNIRRSGWNAYPVRTWIWYLRWEISRTIAKRKNDSCFI